MGTKEKELYLYETFGLQISSEILAPEWLIKSDSKKSDVFIREGKIDIALPEEKFFQVVNGKVLLNIDGVARYLICDGTDIVVEPCRGASNEEVQLYLFGSAIGALLQQRDFLVLHGCGVVHNNMIHLFVGESGIGKSTLAAAFIQKGYKITSDDICALKVSAENKAVVFPSYPQIKLWQQAIAELGLDRSSLKRVWPSEPKYFFPLKKQWCSDSLSLKSITVLESDNVDDFSFVAINGAEKLGVIKNNSYRYFFMSEPRLLKQHFSQGAELIKQVPISLIKRPCNKFSVYELSDFIEKNLFKGSFL